MLRSLLPIIPCFLLSLSVCCQTVRLSGGVFEAASGVAVAYANVTATRCVDGRSTIDAYAVTDQEGHFQLELTADSCYFLQVSYLGYQTHFDTVTIRPSAAPLRIDLSPASNELSTVKVTYRIPVRVSGDTISYASEAFTDGNERKLEDILKKLPGFAVDEAGQISVNGKKIDEFKVNGQDFFGGNSRLAARSLPADAVDRIDVLNNQSQGRQLDGFDDGSRTALNIRLREDKQNLVFGDLHGGAGPNEELDGGTSSFHFSPTNSTNLILNHNNVGRQILTFDDVFRFNGGFTRDRGESSLELTPSAFGLLSDPERSAGHRATLAAVNLQQRFGKKFSGSGSLIHNGTAADNLRSLQRTVLGDPAGTIRQVEKGGLDNRATTGLLKLDYAPSAQFQADYRLLSTFLQRSQNDAIVNSTTSDSLSQYLSDRSQSLKQQLRLTYGSGGKQFFALRLDHTYENGSGGYRLRTDDLPFGLEADSLNLYPLLRQNRNTRATSYGARLDYHLVLNRTNAINLFGGTTWNDQHLDAERALLAEADEAGAMESAIPGDRLLLGSYFAGIGHRLRAGKWQVSPGLRVERARWSARSDRQPVTGGQRTYALPYARLVYAIRKTKNLHLDYESSLDWPGVTQRTYAPLLENFYTLSVGDASLRESVRHGLSLSYSNYDLFNQLTLSSGTTLEYRTAAIGRSIESNERGEQRLTYYNADEPFRLLNTYVRVDKYLEKFKLSGGTSLSGMRAESRIDKVPQLNTTFSASLDVSARTRFKRYPNLSLSADISHDSYQAGARSAVRYLRIAPRMRAYGRLVGPFTFSASYHQRWFRQLAANGSVNRYGRLDGRLSYESENKRWIVDLTGYNLLGSATLRNDDFNEYLLLVTELSVLPARLLLTVNYQL